MNERFLFRGKRKDNGEWVYGGIFYQKSDEVKEKAVYIIRGSLNDVGCAYEVIPETIGQCTGLRDKNGKLIFEGDVVKLTDTNNNIEWKAYVVFGNPYGEFNWGWNLMYIGEKTKVDTDILLWTEMEETGAYCEVIGNVYDNPELLEVER